VVHRPTWPCAKPTELKNFVHQEFHGTHLGTFVGLSNPHISKITNFNFSQNSPPSHIAMPWCKTHRTQNFRAPRLSWYSFGDICRPFQLSHLKDHEFHFFTKLPTKPSSYAVVHRPTWPCAKPTELKNFVHQDFHGTHLGTFVGLSNPHISKITNFNFSQNSPPSHLAMPWCKTHRTQNFGARRLRWYSFGDICRPFQPSHLKNHEFHFFTKLPTKPSSYPVGHRQPWPCAKPTELKTFVHQYFHDTHLGTFVGLSNPHISKVTNFNFSQNSPPSHLA